MAKCEEKTHFTIFHVGENGKKGKWGGGRMNREGKVKNWGKLHLFLVSCAGVFEMITKMCSPVADILTMRGYNLFVCNRWKEIRKVEALEKALSNVDAKPYRTESLSLCAASSQ